MPPQITQNRPVRQRLVTNENDENSNSTRLTRAKAATLNVDELTMPSKGALQPKKSAVNAGNAIPASRKRAALGDLSNVGKNEAVDGKKNAAGKVGLVSKAAQPAGVQKNTIRPASRAALTVKEVKKTEIKRAGSGSGALGASQKRKVTTSAASTVTDGRSADEAEPARKKAHKLDAPESVQLESKIEVESVAAVIPKSKASVQDEVKPLSDVIHELDREDINDPLMVAEYANDVFDYLRSLEDSSKPNPTYMSQQDDVDWKTRGVLIDWLIEVHTRFHLLPETLFLAVNIIDRFLSKKIVQLDRLQLVGITAMFIASKYEEVLSPSVANFKRIADDGFSEDEILNAERFVLSTLDWDLSYPNPINFLRRVSKADNYDIQSRTIGKFLMEISLLDHRFLEFAPSQVAAGAMYLARLMLDRGEWDETLVHYAGYDEKELDPVVLLMVDYLARPLVHEAFFKKYAGKKFMKASILARGWAKKNAPVFGLQDLDLNLDEIS